MFVRAQGRTPATPTVKLFDCSPKPATREAWFLWTIGITLATLAHAPLRNSLSLGKKHHHIAIVYDVEHRHLVFRDASDEVPGAIVLEWS